MQAEFRTDVMGEVELRVVSATPDQALLARLLTAACARTVPVIAVAEDGAIVIGAMSDQPCYLSPDDVAECRICKSGSPSLCATCLHNRGLVARQNAAIDKIRDDLKRAERQRDVALSVADTKAKELDLIRGLLAHAESDISGGHLILDGEKVDATVSTARATGHRLTDRLYEFAGMYRAARRDVAEWHSKYKATMKRRRR